MTPKYRIVELRESSGYDLITRYAVQTEDYGTWITVDTFDRLHDAREFAAFKREFPQGKVVE